MTSTTTAAPALQTVLDLHTAEVAALRTMPVGTRVRFHEDAPQYAKCGSYTFVVQAAPDGREFSVDRLHDYAPEGGYVRAAYPLTGTAERFYVWLVTEETAHLCASKQKTRTGFVTALTVVS